MQENSHKKNPVGPTDRNATTTTALLQRIGALERAARTRDAELQGLKARVGAQARDIAALRRERRTVIEPQTVAGPCVDLALELPALPNVLRWSGFDLARPCDDCTVAARMDATGVCDLRIVQGAQLAANRDRSELVARAAVGTLKPNRRTWGARLRQLSAWLFRSKSCGD